MRGWDASDYVAVAVIACGIVFSFTALKMCNVTLEECQRTCAPYGMGERSAFECTCRKP